MILKLNVRSLTLGDYEEINCRSFTMETLVGKCSQTNNHMVPRKTIFCIWIVNIKLNTFEIVNFKKFKTILTHWSIQQKRQVLATNNVMLSWQHRSSSFQNMQTRGYPPPPLPPPLPFPYPLTLLIFPFFFPGLREAALLLGFACGFAFGAGPGGPFSILKCGCNEGPCLKLQRENKWETAIWAII